jgi:RNA binding exosome subunit
MRTSEVILSIRFPVACIELRAFAHATEDLDKVLTAISNTMPTGSLGSIIFKKTNLSGHYGNPIILIEARIKDKRLTQAVFEKLSSGLSILDKESLTGEVMRHLEGGSLYIRLDKQSAYLSKLKLSSTDPIHLRIHFKKQNPQEVIDVCRKFGLLA